MRQAEEHFLLPLRYEAGVGWVDAAGNPVKTRKWADIKRKRDGVNRGPA